MTQTFFCHNSWAHLVPSITFKKQVLPGTKYEGRLPVDELMIILNFIHKRPTQSHIRPIWRRGSQERRAIGQEWQLE